jgi:glutamate racemase
VIACNTACAVAIGSLRAKHTAPIVGLEPAVKPAARRSKSKKVAVLATPRTARGEKLHQLIETFGTGVRVETIPAPGLVDLIESGRMDSREIRYLLSNLLEGPLARGCDVVVLGCTHYPFLAGTIAEIVGPSVAIVSSGNAVARQTELVLRREGLRAFGSAPGECRYMTTGNAFAFDSVASQLLGTPVRSEVIQAGAGSSIA